VVGVMKSVGVKFDRLLDVTMLQKLLWFSIFNSHPIAISI
jgi:hypothetical protein